MIKQYRKKPASIEALHIDSTSVEFIKELISFCGDKLKFYQEDNKSIGISLKTQSDCERKICIGEYIIKYKNQNIDVLSPRRFEADYEEIK